MIPSAEFESSAVKYDLLSTAHAHCLHQIIVSEVFSDAFRELANIELLTREYKGESNNG